MIERIFFDLDETLLHTIVGCHPGEDCHMHKNVSYEENSYFTLFRPGSNDLIKFARDLIGFKNVYILTAATREYAIEVNRGGNFDFDHDHIFAREDQELCTHKGGGWSYGSSYYVPNKQIAHPNNVLVDNLRARENFGKITFIGINDNEEDEENYIKVRDYYGADNLRVQEENEQIKAQLMAIHKRSLVVKTSE